jgi:hypothetical protein
MFLACPGICHCFSCKHKISLGHLDYQDSGCHVRGILSMDCLSPKFWLWSRASKDHPLKAYSRVSMNGKLDHGSVIDRARQESRNPRIIGSGDVEFELRRRNNQLLIWRCPNAPSNDIFPFNVSKQNSKKSDDVTTCALRTFSPPVSPTFPPFPSHCS